MQKPNCLEIGKPPSSVPLKRKSENIEKLNTLRSSNKDKEKSSSIYSGSKRNAKELALKTTMKGDVHQDSVDAKRKKLTGRAFKSLLREKHNNGFVPEMIPRPAECENCSVLGACVLCSKEKRTNDDSQEKEFCTCNATTQKELDRSSTCKDRVDQRRAASGSAEKCHCSNPLKETHSNRQMDDHGTVCAFCNNDGKLLYCEGKDCNISYHLRCLDPRSPDDLPGIRHCPKCVKKKLELGVYSVSDEVDSIWDVKVSEDKGIKQRHYLVKYQGLAHIHNRWVSEKQLLLKHESLISSFIPKEEAEKRSVEWWTVPHRLLRKRPILDKFQTASPENSSGRHEWLVKWHGLDYDHCTWELDSSYYLSSSLGRDLVKEYEVRREKAKREVDKCQKGSFVEISELPVSGLNVNDNLLLKNVNRLRECWYKCQNTVVLYDQDRTMTLACFIQSLTEICHPFLVIAGSDSLSQWKDEFARITPSVDVVIYNGNSNTRKWIRASEFYEEGGCVMVQVLLSSPEAVFEDIDMLSCIRWQSILIDVYQHPGISIDLEQIKLLSTDSRILLLGSQIKDTASEYLNILSLLDSDHDYNKLRGLRLCRNENLAKLKERLSRFIAYGSTSEISKFIEYWVPVQISKHQLEQYCATLISNSILLCSCSRNDKVGALRDILLTVRKCCDHPYLVDSSIQQHMFAEGRPADEILDVGIKSSGKLHLLSMMLTQVEAQGLKALVLFQSFGSGGCSTGYILTDFLAQKFGQHSYELVFAGVSPTTKQAAVNRFNKKENGQFVLLLENRACSSTIKLSSLDVVILYNSDWNPANDIKALRKISIDLTVEQIKVFRLYSSCTVEERALVLAKKNLNLDSNLQASLSRAACDSLLMWGAVRLFNKLDDYHSESSSELNTLSGQLESNEINDEFKSILSEHGELSKKVYIISKVKLDVGSYSTDLPMPGEADVKLKDVEEPHIFWKNLLGRKNPQWKHITGQCQRYPKRAHYLENINAENKRRSTLTDDVYQASSPSEIRDDQEIQIFSSEGGPSKIIDDKSGRSTCSPAVEECGAEEKNASSNEQKSLRDSLNEEMERVCQILKLSEDLTHTMRRFLEYVILNNRIWRDSPEIMQAFQISLLWVAASISKQEVDKIESVISAKHLLNYQCTEEQVHSVYSKMLDLKWKYMQCSPTSVNVSGSPLLAEKTANNETFNTNDEHCEGHNLSQLKEEATHKCAAPNAVDNNIIEVRKRCDKRMRKLVTKQKKELQEVFRNWEAKKLKLETDKKMAAALIRCIYGEGSARIFKLKLLDDKFEKEMEENDLFKDVGLKDLEDKQLAVRNEEIEKAAHWIAQAKAHCSSELGTVNTPAVKDVSNASGERFSDEMGSIELNKEVPPEVSENVIVDNVGLTDASAIPLARQMLEQTEASLHRCDSLLLQVPNDQNTVQFKTEIVDSVTPDAPTPTPTPTIEDHGARQIEDTNSEQGVTITRDAPGPAVENHGTLQIEGINSEQGVTVTRKAPTPTVEEHGILEIEGTNSEQGGTVIAPGPAIEDHDPLHIEGSKSTQGGTLSPDASAPAVEDHDTIQIDGTNSPTPAPVVEDHDAPAPTVEDHGTLRIDGTNSAQAVENRGQLNHVSNDEYPTVKQSTGIQVENQNIVLLRNSSKNAEGAQTDMLRSEMPPRTRVNSEMQTNDINIEPPNQALLQLGIDLGNRDTSRDSSFLSEQLFKKQLDDIGRENEELEKKRVETKLQMKSDFEKEIEEIIAQALKRYEVKLKDAEAQYKSMKDGLIENRKKVCMNKILAKAFSGICEDIQSSGLPGIQQDTLSLHEPSLQNPVSINRLQTFRPSATSLNPQNRPDYQGGPQSPWGSSLPALDLLRVIHRQSRIPGGLNFFGFY